ncbi:MAG TPA: ABC transporter substrate-binding protein [Thermoplasmata archaeon]|nr:ABC transporter substrate-binding protein [Thermoplasmata archaeon]
MWIAIAVVVIIVIAGVAIAFYAGVFSTPGLRIGTVLSLTGDLSPYGPDNQNGTDMAVAEINAAGGVLGHPILIYHTDDQTKPDAAAAAARALISTDQVNAIVGATGSGQCAQVVPIASANHVFEISGSCTSPIFSNLTLTNGFWARTAPSDALQGVVAAYYAHHNLTTNYTAVIGINNAYGTGLAGVYAGAFKKFGGNVTDSPIVTVTEVGAGATDYSTQLSQIMSATPAPQLIYLAGYPADGVLMMKNWNTLLGTHASWSSVKWMFSEGLYDQKNFLTALFSTYGAGEAVWQGSAPSAYGGITGPNYPAWQASFKAKFGHTPTLFDDTNYDAVYMIAMAAQIGGSYTGDTIKANIQKVAVSGGTTILPGQWSAALTAISQGKSVNYVGASGGTQVNQYGDPLSGYVIWGANSTGAAIIKQIFPQTLVSSLVSSVGSLSVGTASVGGLTWSPVAATVVARES